MSVDTEVWVNDYTTSTGVHVAGHWRSRRASVESAEESVTGGPLAANGDVDQPDREHSTETRPWLALSPGRLAAAEERYRSASCAAGISALRQRRGQATDHTALLRERAATRVELKAAQQEAAEGAGAGRCPGCGQYAETSHQCPVPAGLPEGDYSGMKGDERVRSMVADLESSVKAIVESGQLHRWLGAMASNGLTRWSANNRILAAVQVLQRGGSLEELHLMGFRQWENFDRKVSKGAKAVWILAPVTRKVVEEDETGDTTERRRVVGFKGVPVFNISDTQGKPLPAAPTRPAAGAASSGTVEGLRDRVAESGYSYEETEIPGCNPQTGQGTLGYTEPGTKRIVVDARLGGAQKASTIAHELGHVHCGHVDADYSEYQRHRGRMETEAEMTAYLVNRSRGMSRDQVEAFSPGYIAGWSKDDPAAMRSAVDKATGAFNKIMDGPWPTTNKGA